MKYKDKICDAFDNLNKELDSQYAQADGVEDNDSININDIEDKIMDKIEKMIESKLTPASSDNPPENPQDNLNENEGDNNNED